VDGALPGKVPRIAAGAYRLADIPRVHGSPATGGRRARTPGDDARRQPSRCWERPRRRGVWCRLRDNR